jgi:diketogulonate reductase-like aldo/keto reductase
LAIKNGVRHLDCACDYGNEVEVGQGIAKAISENIVTRNDLFITSKLWNTYHSKEHVEIACKKDISDLNCDYLDLYLVHFPIALKYVPIETRYPPEWIYDPMCDNPKIEQVFVPMSETWKEMENLQNIGLTKNIGVCNFNVQNIMDILGYCKIKPAVNQVELHPYLTQTSLLEYCEIVQIHVTAYSPLGSSSYVEMGMDQGLSIGARDEISIKEIASLKNKTPAQVILRWYLSIYVTLSHTNYHNLSLL